MWPDWVFTLMLIVAACLFVFLAWELIKDVNTKLACWWIARRNARLIAQWERQRARNLTEALR